MLKFYYTLKAKAINAGDYGNAMGRENVQLWPKTGWYFTK